MIDSLSNTSRYLIIFIGVIIAHGLILMMLIARTVVTPPQLINVSLIGFFVSAPVSASFESNTTTIPDLVIKPKEEILAVEKATEPSVNIVHQEEIKPEKDIVVKPQPKPVTQPPNMLQRPTSATNNQNTVMSKGDPSGQEGIVAAPSYTATSLRNMPPRYPTMSRKLNEQGTVILNVLISDTGEVKELTIKVSSGFRRLDQAAVDAVNKWRFIPAKKGNQPLEMRYDVPVKFSLSN